MNTVALVTLYNPDEKIFERIKLLSKQVSKVVLLDNSPVFNDKDDFSFIENCVYHFFEKNLGLSAAFNWALKNFDFIKSSDFILFFDQDSCVSENLVSTLVNDFTNLSKSQKIGFLGPVYFDSTRNELSGITKRSKKITENIYEVSEIITSAMITTYEVLECIGFWNESIFLDYADFELCWRGKKYGFKTFITKNTVLNHSLGAGLLKCRLLKMSFNYSSAFREYYQSRAAVKLLKRSYVPANWKRNFIFNLTVRIFIYLIHLPQKINRLKYFWLGILHGLFNKSGELKRF